MREKLLRRAIAEKELLGLTQAFNPHHIKTFSSLHRFNQIKNTKTEAQLWYLKYLNRDLLLTSFL